MISTCTPLALRNAGANKMVTVRTDLWRKPEDVGLDPTKDVWLNHLVQFGQQSLVEVFVSRLQVLQIPVRISWFHRSEESEGLLEIDGIKEVEQVEQFSKVVVEWCTRQQDPVDRIERLEAVKD